MVPEGRSGVLRDSRQVRFSAKKGDQEIGSGAALLGRGLAEEISSSFSAVSFHGGLL